MDNLGQCLIDQSKYEEALEFLEEALAIRSQMLGLEHPSTVAVEEIVSRLAKLPGEEPRDGDLPDR